ncbi:MAG TPA: hypothetical protein VNJ52_13530 [Patescibacteria group bacterium]|nr:hypothetical protein [Patescibacteria group bacterium]
MTHRRSIPIPTALAIAWALFSPAAARAQQSTYVPGTSSAAATSISMPGGATLSGAGGAATLTANHSLNLDAAGGLRVAGRPLDSVPADMQEFSTQSNAILSPGASGFDQGSIDSETWIEANGQIYLFYCGWNAGETQAEIGVATGPNFQSLTKQGVVLAPGSAGAWDSGYVCGPRIFHQNGTYYLFYFGGQGTSYEAAPSSIGVATSTDLVTWTKASVNPILTPGTTGAWDAKQLFRPFAFEWQGTDYLFYNAANAAGEEQIGYATASSPTGPWTKYASNPVFSPTGSGWESSHVFDPEIFRFAGTWAMLYSGFGTGQGIGWAFSSDLNTWTRSALNPLYVEYQASAVKMEVHLLGNQWLGIFEQTSPGIFVAQGLPYPFRSSLYSAGQGAASSAHPWWVTGSDASNNYNFSEWDGTNYTSKLMVSGNGPVQMGDNAAGLMNTSVPIFELYEPGTNAYELIGQASSNNLVIGWTYNSNAANGFGLIETYANSNPLVLQSSGGKVGIGAATTPQTTLDVTGTIRANPTTFASLPSCSSTIEGAMRSVTDSTTNTWGASVAGGGADHVLAYCNSANWTVAAK